MRSKLYQHKFSPPWGPSFGRKHKTSGRNQIKIVANPALIMKVLRRKKIFVFLAYFFLVALTMLNVANYKWMKEPQQCSQQTPRLSDSSFHSRSDLRFLYTAPQTSRKQLVYVLTTWRSGSSFFGELFNQNPGVFFMFEPLWHVWQKLYPADAVSLQGAQRDMLRAIYRCDFSVFQMYQSHTGKNLTTVDLFGSGLNKVVCSYPLCSSYRKDVVGMVDEKVCKMCPPQDVVVLERECRKYGTIVIKGVRILDVNILAPLLEDPSLNLKIIHLVRDPRAVANSRIKTKHALMRENFQVLRSKSQKAQYVDHRRKYVSDFYSVSTMEVICEYMSYTLKSALSPPDWLKGKYMLVRYEDLAKNPVQTLRNAYRFANLTISSAIESFVMNMTGGGSSYVSSFQVSSRNATHAANAWRTLLSYEQVKQVETYCSYAMSVLGYLPIQSPAVLKNLSVSLLTLPKL
ncbi:carbohydrate sulfotransferase 2a [Brachyhypopomus gauderio]|uniref:carbohydrate sulfotransferase 2a n=1 Tax=Brachyhypopomus gauderio TaxID=698409 RepID=UPI0040430B37